MAVTSNQLLSGILHSTGRECKHEAVTGGDCGDSKATEEFSANTGEEIPLLLGLEQ